MMITVIEETKTSDGDDSDDNGDENFFQDSLASSAVLLAPQVPFTKIYFCLTGVLDFFFHQKIFISLSTLKSKGDLSNTIISSLPCP